MIWRWLTFISLFPALLPAAAVTGKVELRDSREPAVRKRMDYSGVVVSLEPLNKSAEPKVPPARATMTQKDKLFSPHVLAVQAGASVDFPNYDPIFHNAFSNYDGQVFDIGLYPPGTSRTVRFTRPGVVRVFCNIHAEMSAVIVVVDTPWFDTTRPDGSFEIRGVPPGDYRLTLFHERATPAELSRASRTITVGAGPAAVPAITISESGFLPIPHKNKFGRDYPPPPEDTLTYPAVRK